VLPDAPPAAAVPAAPATLTPHLQAQPPAGVPYSRPAQDGSAIQPAGHGVPAHSSGGSSLGGSASAAPGAAFFSFGLASLAALLIGLAGPRLSGRVRQAASRSFSVFFLSPLERPG
jgi:hypothetical protein